MRLKEKDELGAIKPVNLIPNYQEIFYLEMVHPLMEGRKVSWDHFLPISLRPPPAIGM